jgi:hypothetical protein
MASKSIQILVNDFRAGIARVDRVFYAGDQRGANRWAHRPRPMFLRLCHPERKARDRTNELLSRKKICVTQSP